MTKKSNEGSWIRIVPNFRNLYLDNMNFNHVMSYPIHHLYGLFDSLNKDYSFWAYHFNYLDSIENSFITCDYYSQIIPQLIEKEIKPNILKDAEEDFKHMEKDNANNIVKILESKLNDSYYYIILSGIWSYFICYTSIFDYVEKYCNNLIKCCKILNEKRELLNLDQALVLYLKDYSKFFKNIKRRWIDYKKNETTQNIIKLRHFHVHESIWGSLMIDWDSVKKDLYLSFSNIYHFDVPYISLKKLFSEIENMKQNLFKLAHSILDNCFKIIEKNNLRDKLEKNNKLRYDKNDNITKKTFCYKLVL